MPFSVGVWWCFLCLGEAGLGKSTLIQSLFLTNFFGDKHNPPAIREFCTTLAYILGVSVTSETSDGIQVSNDRTINESVLIRLPAPSLVAIWQVLTHPQKFPTQNVSVTVCKFCWRCVPPPHPLYNVRAYQADSQHRCYHCGHWGERSQVATNCGRHAWLWGCSRQQEMVC